MRRIVVGLVVLVVLALVAGACSSGDDDGATNPAAPIVTEPAGTGSCDEIDPSACLLPWPNDRFTRADPTTTTGRRLDLPAEGMPVSASGTPIDAGEWNRNDGFAPTSHLLTYVEDLDIEASGLAPVTDIARSLDDDSPLVLIDAATGERVPAWAELDANAGDAARRALTIVPATALVEGHRHVVGLRDLVRLDGADVDPAPSFVDQLEAPDETAEAMLADLGAAGVDADDLDVAWSFTVGSADSISGRLRHMWNETEEALGDGAPAFTVTSEEPSGPARIVQGTFEVPKYLQGDGGPGSYLNNDDDPDGLPTADGTMLAEFFCTVPASATGDSPAPTIIYGHGLLGTRVQTLDIGLVGAAAGIAFCGLDYIGMSSADVPVIVESFDDLTRFRALPDRLQQGHLAFLSLGRLLASDQGFGTHESFRVGGASILDPEAVSLLGASQGGILGGVASALTNDWQQVVLAVPGMGYNLLLRRSINFDDFFPAVEASYPDELEQVLVLDLLQQLWQRGEVGGYAQHLTTDPYPGIEAKEVLLLEAFGDHQVANVSTQKLARTLGIGRVDPTLAEGRSTDVEPYWGIEPIDSLPAEGSALVTWDFGTPAPPTENLPNRAGDDPHGKLADVPEALQLVLAFVGGGMVVDVCGEGPCTAPG